MNFKVKQLIKLRITNYEDQALRMNRRGLPPLPKILWDMEHIIPME